MGARPFVTVRAGRIRAGLKVSVTARRRAWSGQKRRKIKLVSPFHIPRQCFYGLSASSC